MKNYKPTKEDIKRICDEAFEENKELILGIFREFEKRGD